MPRVRIEDIRRRELAEAAFEVLQRGGLSGTTLARVAEQAGVSKGIVLHYFKNKAELIEATMRLANALLRDEVIVLLNRAETPRERVQAVIDGNFSPRFFRPEIAHAWLALCAEVPRNPQYARIQTVIHRRMRSNLMSGLADLLPRDDAEAVALAITSLIDGLWLRCGLQTGGIDRDLALDQMRRYLDQSLPPEQMRPRTRDRRGYA